MKKLALLVFVLTLLVVFVGCTSGITTPGTGTGTGGGNQSSAKIKAFTVSKYTPGEKVKLSWDIDGTYDEVKLSKREVNRTYESLLDTEENPGEYEDINIEDKKVYLYKLEVLSGGSIQDVKRYIVFSSPNDKEGVRVIYNVNLDDPENHKISVDMWIDTGSYSNVNLKTVANHFQDIQVLRVSNWSSTSYAGSISGSPDSKISLSGKGLYFIHYQADLPPQIMTENLIQGLFNNRFFLAAGCQHLLLVKEDEQDKLSYVYKTYNTFPNWDVYSPEESLEDKTYLIDFSDIDGCYFAYQEDSVLSAPQRTFYTEERNIYGTDMQVVLDKRIPNYTKYPQYMFKIFENECWIFGEGIGKRYGVYVVHYDQDLYTSENTYSQGYSDTYNIVGEMYTHQIFHRWNGWPPYGTDIEPEPEYFRAFYSESWNNYFNDWNRTQVLPDYNWNDLKRSYHTYKTEYLGTPKDTPVALYGNGDTFIWYWKGPLVVYLLNKEIERVTGGEKSMVDVQREVWNRYGHGNGRFNYEDIIQIINEITGADFHGFFNDYVFGTKEIKIPEFE